MADDLTEDEMHALRKDGWIFVVGVRDPTKQKVYADLIDKLKKILKVNVNTGSSKNVIKIWKEGITCDLVLLSESDYKEQIKTRRYSE